MLFAQEFNAFAFENYEGIPHSEGPVAAGKLIKTESFAINDQSSYEHGVVSGGDIDLRQGAVYGTAQLVGRVIDDYNVDLVTGYFFQDTNNPEIPFSFELARARLTTYSEFLAKMQTNGTVDATPWSLFLQGEDPVFNVFSLATSQLDVYSIDIDVPTGSTALINVSGTTADMTYLGMQLAPGTSSNQIVWNFVDATSINLAGIGFKGSALAPRADVTFNHGDFNGTLVAKNIRGTGEFHNVPFQGTLPDACPSCTLLGADNHPGLTPGQLDFNRYAVEWSQDHLRDEGFYKAHDGFRWNDGDNEFLGWRPQGITGYTEGREKYLIVTWYGLKLSNYTNNKNAKHKNHNHLPSSLCEGLGEPYLVDGYCEYAALGARISIVRVTDMSRVVYRHVLLTDEDGTPLHGLHAGGAHYVNGELHVADSRSGGNHVLVFNIDEIIEVNKTHNYRYELPKTRSYDVPNKASWLSFNWQLGEFMVGTFDGDARADISWYGQGGSAEGNEVSDLSPVITRHNFPSSMNGGTGAGSLLWTAQTNGRGGHSYVRARCFDPYVSGSSSNNISYEYPPGLEDMHASLTSDNIWMLTEFGPNERSDPWQPGHGNHRMVFSVKRQDIFPDGVCLPTAQRFQAELEVSSDGGQSYCQEVIIGNRHDEPTYGWSFDIDFGLDTPTFVGNAYLKEMGPGVYNFSNLPWNGAIAGGDSFGATLPEADRPRFCATRANPSDTAVADLRNLIVQY